MSDTCPECGHQPHAGRCFFVATPKGRYIECRCRHKLEESNDADRRNDRGDPGLDTPAVRPAVGRGPSLGALEHQARRRLTAAGIELLDIGTDLLGQINAIGDTMTNDAARLRGEEGHGA